MANPYIIWEWTIEALYKGLGGTYGERSAGSERGESDGLPTERDREKGMKGLLTER